MLNRIVHPAPAGRHGWTTPTRFLTLLFCSISFLSIAFLPDHAAAQWAPTKVRVVEGRSTVLRHPEKIQTVSLANDQIADVVAITSDELVVIGRKVGNTTLLVWGESLRYMTYEIQVDRNFSGKQIILEVHVGEVSKNTFSDLGFDWTWLNKDDDFVVEGDKTIGSFTGRTTGPSVPLTPGQSTSGFFKYVGDLNEISATVRALQGRGDFKLLASPRLLCLSGSEASFLSGGEIPVPAGVTLAGGLEQVKIEWKEYGISLKFKPTIIDSNLINLKVMPEVSSLDFNNAIILSGFAIPALLTRRADATVELASGQAMLLGGLVATEEFKDVRRVPILGHIPLLGAIFTRKESSTQENELVILIMPRIFGSPDDEPLPALPWDGSLNKKPDDADSTEETGAGGAQDR